MSYLDQHNVLFKNQHGFHKSFSCETQSLQLKHEIHTNFEKKTQTEAVFRDLSKAFDSVPHVRLIAKLNTLKIHPTIVNWIS